MAKILEADERGFGILIENDAGLISRELNPNLLTKFNVSNKTIKIITCSKQGGNYYVSCVYSEKYSNKIILVEIQVQNNDDYTKNQVEKYNVTLVPTLIFIDSKDSLSHTFI